MSNPGKTMDDLIRGSRGGSPSPLAEPSPAATELQVRAAREEGVPLDMAHRLNGDSLHELAVDAGAFRAFLVHSGRPVPEPEPPVDFSGGVRGSAFPEPPPTMGSMVTAALEEVRAERLAVSDRTERRAVQIDTERAR